MSDPTSDLYKSDRFRHDLERAHQAARVTDAEFYDLAAEVTTASKTSAPALHQPDGPLARYLWAIGRTTR